MMINSATLFSIGFIAYSVLMVLFHMLHNNDLYVICIKLDILLPRIINVSVMSMGKYHKRAGDKMTRCLI